MDYSLPDSSVHGILQAGILEWLPFPTPGDLPNPGIEPTSLLSPALAGVFFTTSATWEVERNGCSYVNVLCSPILRPLSMQQLPSA